MTERMRFFSRAWQRGDFRDEEAQAIRDRYYSESPSVHERALQPYVETSATVD